MVGTTGEPRETSSCSLLFTPRLRRASGLEEPSPARVRSFMGRGSRGDRSCRIEMEKEEERILQKVVVGGGDDSEKE